MAVNEDTILYTVLENLDDCTYMRDTAVCNSINILHKSTHNTCLFDLFSMDLQSALKTCKYRVGRPQNFAVRLSDKEIFIFCPNQTVLTTKCYGDHTSTKTYAQGANILHLENGCRVTSHDFVFKRNRKIVEEEVAAVLVNSPAADMWNLLSQKSQEEAIKPFLKLMLQKEERGIPIADIESKFNLHKLHHKTNLTRNVFSSITGLITIIVVVTIIYACRENLTCKKKPAPIHTHFTSSEPSMRMTDLASSSSESFLQPIVLNPSGTRETRTKKKSTNKPQ